MIRAGQKVGWSRRAAFTLMEVNLAIFIMAVGVLAMVSLYPLGYRESQQARDDVRSAALADLVLGQVTAALSSRNITWNDWKSSVGSAVNETSEGWKSYMERRGNHWVPMRTMSTKAANVLNSLMRANKDYGSATRPGTSEDDLKYAVVAQWGVRPIVQNSGSNPTVEMKKDYSRVCVSFRATRRAGALFSQPLYYTEIHFQGDQEDTQGGGSQP